MKRPSPGGVRGGGLCGGANRVHRRSGRRRQQLILYYFGGKRGLLQALRAESAEREPYLVAAYATFADSVAHHVGATLDQPEWARLSLWQALAPHPAQAGQPTFGQLRSLRSTLGRVRRRQASGELRSDLEPEFIFLMEHAVALAPFLMPQVVEGLYGVASGSDEYRRRAVGQLVLAVGTGTGRRTDKPAARPEAGPPI